MNRLIAVATIIIFAAQTHLVASERKPTKETSDSLAPMRSQQGLNELAIRTHQRAERAQREHQAANPQHSRESVSAPAAQQPAEITNVSREDALITLVGLGVTAAVAAGGYFYSYWKPETPEKK